MHEKIQIKETMMKKQILSLLIAFLFLTGCSSGEMLLLGTAPRGGVYYSFGVVFSDIARYDGLNINVRETSGSSANLRLLSKGYIQTGIAQSDQITHAYTDTDSPLQGYSAVASLYDEAVMIVVRADSDIQSVEDLYGRSISIGEPESGSAQNAREVLQSYGLTPQNYTSNNLGYSDAVNALREKKIDAMFLTASPNSELLADLDHDVPIRLLSIDDKILERLWTVYPYFSDVRIPKELFRGMNEDARTVGVRSILLAADTLSEDTVYLLTSILFSHASEFDVYLNSQLSVKPESALEAITIPLHKGALKYYDEHGFDTRFLR